MQIPNEEADVVEVDADLVVGKGFEVFPFLFGGEAGMRMVDDGD